MLNSKFAELKISVIIKIFIENKEKIIKKQTINIKLLLNLPELLNTAPKILLK